MGENLVHLAERHPGAWILGIEVHKPGLGAALARLRDRRLTNVRVMRGDARLILSDHLAGDVRFRRVGVLFPDPWPEEGDAHRRLIQPDFFELIEPRMEAGGIFHFATDVATYRRHADAVIASRAGWAPHPGVTATTDTAATTDITATTDTTATTGTNPITNAAPIKDTTPTAIDLESFRGPTRYEEKGRSLGHRIHDLFYRWSPGS